MPLFLTVAEIRKVCKWSKIRFFFEFFGPPCRNPLANLSETTPIFLSFKLPSTRSQGPIDPRGGRSTSADIVPTQIKFGVDPSTRCCRRNPQNSYYHVTQFLLRYRSKTTKMQKFPIDYYSNENFISPFFCPGGR